VPATSADSKRRRMWGLFRCGKPQSRPNVPKLNRPGTLAGTEPVDRHAVYKAIVQVSGSASALPIGFARQVARESEEFRTAIVRHEQLILAQAQQSAACNAAHNLQERLARWLLRRRDRQQ
jgi:hypothetical protein